MLRQRLTSVALSLAAVGATMLISTPSASATVPGYCVTGGGAGICTFWGQNYDGAQIELGTRADLASPIVYYPANGSGQGEHVYNNNGSERNGNPGCSAAIYYDPNYSGYSVTFAPFMSPGYEKAGSQLGRLLNNIRSIRMC